MSKLRILLSSELDLIRALDLDDEDGTKDPSKGSGKEKLQIEEILKKL